MFYKNFNRCLECLLGTAILLSVTAHPIVDDTGIFNHDKLNGLAYGVCSDLDADGFLMENNNNLTALDNCMHEFTGPTVSSMKVPSGVTIMCRKPTSIRYKITQSKKMQVLLLVSHPLNTEEYDIDYNLVEPETIYDMMLTMPGLNYTLWVTELDNGQPLQWRGGEKVPLYNELPHRDYNISAQFFFTNISKKLELTGVFTWNTSGDGDICFDVLDQCSLDKSYFDEWPTKNPRIVIKSLRPNESCSIRVTGIYGSTDFTYNTPPCEDPYACLIDSLEARNPREIDLRATEEDSDTWSIRVNWTRALIPPKRYKVTLWLAGNTTLLLPGNATEAVFHHVTGEGFYTVSIYSFIINGTHTSVSGLFPSHSVRESNSVSVSIAWLVAAMVTSILMTVCYWRRTSQHRIIDNFQPKKKLAEETEVESVTVEAEPVGDCWEVRSDSLLLHEVIGEGAFGVVRKGTMSPCGRDVAVKMLKERPTVEEIRSFRSEMELMKSVGVHPHIVSLVGCCSGRRLLIIAEYCGRGDLLTYLRTCWDILVSKRNAKHYNNTVTTTEYKNDLFRCNFQNNNTKLIINQMYDLQELCDKELTNIDLLSFCRQIAKGMEYLSVNKVVHRDLAARNVLVTNDMTLKIADFGLSRDVYEENQYKQKGGGKLPVKWMALESLTRQIYSTQSDVWSFGVVMWEVVTVGGVPYSGVPVARLPRMLRAGYRMQRPHNCSKQLYELMMACWRKQPRDRPTFVQIQEELDKLLADASADRYLTLELEPDDLPPTNKFYKLLKRSNHSCARGSYERPLMAPQNNHYSSSPMVLPRIPV